MPESLVHWQNGQFADLQAQLAALRQENRDLRSRLQACQQSQANFTQEHRLLEAIATAANALLTTEPFDAAVNTALQIIGEALETDRVTVIENLDNSADSSLVYWQALYEWCSPYTVSQVSHPDLAQGSWKGIEEWYERCRRGQGVICLLEDMPEPFRSGQAKIGVKALHIVPIFVEDHYWGVIGFDDCREAKQRSAAELAVLQIAADCIGSAIQRERTQQALLQAEQARSRSAAERSRELERANNALQGTVAALADRCDLEGFIGEVLHTIAREFESPLVEYWTVLGTDTVEVNMWLWGNQLCSLKQNDNHPGQAGNQVICPTEWYTARGVCGHFNFPLQAGNVAVGMINVWLPPDRQITEECLRLGQALSHQTALAIQLTQLAEEAKQAAIAREQERAAQERAAELVKVNEALKRSLDALATDSDLNQFIGHVLKIAAEQLDAPVVEYWSTSNNTAHLELTCWQGKVLNHEQIPNHPHRQVVAVPPELAAHKTLLQGQRHSIVDDLLTEPLHARLYLALECDLEAWCNQHQVRRELNVPLRLGATIIGTLCVYFPADRPFTQQQIELSDALAQQVTLALRLTQLAEEAKQAVLLEERNRMAREIHDTLAQSFTSIGMQLEAATRFLDRKPAQAQSCLAYAQELARSGLAEARRSVWALQSEAEHYRQLAVTLQQLATQRSTEISIPIEVAIVGTPCPLPADVGMNLLRIAQEALNNAICHAQAQTILLTLTYEPNQIQLQIQDNGQGFDPQLKRNSGGFGLMGMQQRCDRLGGTLEITSRLGYGTEVRVAVPV